jgi:hypothetical protein
MLYPHLSSSSLRDDKIDPVVVGVSSELSLTPPHKLKRKSLCLAIA